ncbi:MAG: hypothetical protein EHM40_14745 [Chloroflexi bacterium]|nr:MAG: hypothetical protein EHM40_14745 [Chloroflexota bacterium]
MNQQQSKHKFTKNAGLVVLLLSVICVLAAYFPYVYTERISDETWIFRFAYAFALLGVLPAGIVFIQANFQ